MKNDKQDFIKKQNNGTPETMGRIYDFLECEGEFASKLITKDPSLQDEFDNKFNNATDDQTKTDLLGRYNVNHQIHPVVEYFNTKNISGSNFLNDIRGKIANPNYILSVGQIGKIIEMMKLNTTKKNSAKDKGDNNILDVNRRKKSKHVGTVGNREEFILRIMGVKEYKNHEGEIHFYNMMRDEDNNRFLSVSSIAFGEKDDSVFVTADISEHKVYGNEKQTNLTNVDIHSLIGAYSN